MNCEEIIKMYGAGELSKGDALSFLTDIAAADGVEVVLHRLPNSWGKDLRTWIFDVYDNDTDSDDFLDFGDPESDLELRRRSISALRRWIAAQKSSDQSGF